MPLRPHARTLAIARFLRAAAPQLHRRRGGRLVRQQQPDAIRRSYFDALMPFIRDQLAPARADRSEILQLLIELRREQGKTDVDREQRAQMLVERSGRAAALAFRPRELHDVATQFGKRVDQFNKVQLNRQVEQAIGVPLASIEKPIRDLIPVFAKANVDLVRTVPERFHDRLARDVREAFETGMHPETLAQRFVELDDMAESDARRIARDQIGKLNAQFNQERQEAMGVTGYTWRTSHDNRVRDEHAERDGQHFEWDDPPEDGHPGEPVQCRCTAEPDFSPILEDL